MENQKFICPNCGSLYESACLCNCYGDTTQTVDIYHWRKVTNARIAREEN